MMVKAKVGSKSDELIDRLLGILQDRTFKLCTIHQDPSIRSFQCTVQRGLPTSGRVQILYNNHVNLHNSFNHHNTLNLLKLKLSFTAGLLGTIIPVPRHTIFTQSPMGPSCVHTHHRSSPSLSPSWYIHSIFHHLAFTVYPPLTEIPVPQFSMVQLPI